MVEIRVIKTKVKGMFAVIAKEGNRVEVWNKGTSQPRAVKLAQALRRYIYPR